MDTLGGRPALDVGDVALQGLGEKAPCLPGVGPGQHPGADHAAERRAVCGAVEVVGDGLRELRIGHLVAQVAQQLPQLVAGQQEQQHQYVGLLGQLVPVGAVALGLEYPVQPLDVAVPGPVALPVELLQLVVAFELGELAAGVEDHPHLAW